jgi:hypothetical protein
LTLEEPTISDLGVEALGPANPPITDLSASILVQVVPPEVTPSERQLVLQATMEENVATSSGSPHTPISATTTGGILPPIPPSPVQTTVVLTPSTSGSGLIPSSAATTAPFTQSATGPPFSYGMPGFDSNSVLTYSTLHTMGLGERSSNNYELKANNNSKIDKNIKHETHVSSKVSGRCFIETRAHVEERDRCSFSLHRKALRGPQPKLSLQNEQN